MEYNVAQELVDQESFVRCPLDPAEDGKLFQMGSPESDDDARDDERPQHEVTITPFRLQRSPILNLQFELFDPSHRFRRDQFSPEDNHPAVWVSWYMADLFCTWLGEGYRLPTEAEWEYAARAGTETRFWWGNEFDKSKCHNKESGLSHTLPPDESRANPWALVDMLGNGWEWCLDGKRNYDGDTQRDPVGPQDDGSFRVYRGGSWAFFAWFCRSAYRYWDSAAFRDGDLCFRLVIVTSGGAGSKKPEEAEPGAEAEGACD